MILLVSESIKEIDRVMPLISDMDEVMVAFNENEALDVIQNELPSIILINMGKNEINGNLLYEKLKNKIHILSLPVAFLTDQEDLDERHIAEGYFLYSMDSENLRQVILNNL